MGLNADNSDSTQEDENAVSNKPNLENSFNERDQPERKKLSTDFVEPKRQVLKQSIRNRISQIVATKDVSPNERNKELMFGSQMRKRRH